MAVAAALILPSFAVVAGLGGVNHSWGLPIVPGDLDGSASASTTGLGYAFGAPPIAPAGALGPNQSVTVVLKVKNNGVADPGGPVYLNYNSPASGDSTTVPGAQCSGVTQPSRNPVLRSANSAGQVSLTYTAPVQPPAQDVVLFTAGNTASNPSITISTQPGIASPRRRQPRSSTSPSAAAATRDARRTTSRSSRPRRSPSPRTRPR